MTKAMLFKVAGDRRCVCNKLWHFCLTGAMLYKPYKSPRYSKRFCYSCSACHVLWSLTIICNYNGFLETCSFSFIISYWYVWYVWVANSPERMNSHASGGLWLGAMLDARTSSSGHLLKRAQMTTNGREAGMDIKHTLDIMWYDIMYIHIYIYTI